MGDLSKAGDIGGCRACQGENRTFELAMAFQPIVDLHERKIFAYEALVRGPGGEPAGEVLSQVNDETRYAFDQQCRVAAIEGAVAAGILETGAMLSINFLPNAVYSPKACIQLTLKTARACGFPANRLMFEFTENERMADTAHVANIVEAYAEMGFATAIDDFGAGHAGLGLLANFRTSHMKLDMDLIRGVDSHAPRRSIVEGIVSMARLLGVTVIAEGIETEAEMRTLEAIGIRYIQGYYLARPAFKELPRISFAELAARTAA